MPITFCCFIGLILTLLRSFTAISLNYIYTTLPITIALCLYPILQTMRWCMSVVCPRSHSIECICCCDGWCNGWEDVYFNRYQQRDNYKAAMCHQSLFISIPLIMFIILFTLHLDGIVDWKYVYIFIPLYVFIGFYGIITQIIILITTCYYSNAIECCDELLPSSLQCLRRLNCFNDCEGKPIDNCYCIDQCIETIIDPYANKCQSIVSDNICDIFWNIICCCWICNLFGCFSENTGRCDYFMEGVCNCLCWCCIKCSE